MSSGQPLRHPVDLLLIPPPCPADQPAPIHLAPLQGVPVEAPSPAGDGGGDAVLRFQRQMLSQRVGLVRSGGVVVVVTRMTPSRDGAIDRIGPVITQARSLGLRYLQHVPVVHADLRQGRFHPAYGPDDPAWHLNLTDQGDLATWHRLGLRHPASSDGVGPTGEPRLHMPIHSDVLVFYRDTDTDTEPATDLAVLVPGRAQ